MSNDSDDLPALVRAVVTAARDEGVTFLAAAVAYYAFVSLVPLVLVSVAVATALGGPELADGVVATFDQFLSPEAQTLARNALNDQEGRGAATLVGTAAFLWGGLKMFRGLDRAFSSVYGSGPDGSLLEELLDAVVVLGAIGLGLLAVGVVDEAIRRVTPGLHGLVGGVVLFASLVVALFPLYYVFPDRPVAPRAALPGTLFAAVGWTLLQTLFQVYASTVGSGSVYGLLGGALLLVTWMYFGAIVVILGAVVNATLEGREPPPAQDRQLQHPGPRQGRPERMSPGDDATAEDADGPDSDATPVPNAVRSEDAPKDGEIGPTPGERSGPGPDPEEGSRGPPRTDGGSPRDGDDGTDDANTDDGEGSNGDEGADEERAGEEEGPGEDEGSGGDGGAEDPDWSGSTFEDGDDDPEDANTAGSDGVGDGEEDPGGGNDVTGDGREGPGGYRRGPDGDREGRLSDDDGVQSEFDRLWEELEDLETRVDDKTVSRSSLESELRAYVRARLRRGHARGWGPYLVLLYGTAMTLGAFHYLESIWAILAMVVLWLSTLGLYTLMIIVGIGFDLLGLLGKARGLAGKVRSEE